MIRPISGRRAGTAGMATGVPGRPRASTAGPAPIPTSGSPSWNGQVMTWSGGMAWENASRAGRRSGRRPPDGGEVTLRRMRRVGGAVIGASLLLALTVPAQASAACGSSTEAAFSFPDATGDAQGDVDVASFEVAVDRECRLSIGYTLADPARLPGSYVFAELDTDANRDTGLQGNGSDATLAVADTGAPFGQRHSAAGVPGPTFPVSLFGTNGVTATIDDIGIPAPGVIRIASITVFGPPGAPSSDSLDRAVDVPVRFSPPAEPPPPRPPTPTPTPPPDGGGAPTIVQGDCRAGGTELPGNRVDEDCDGEAAGFPVVAATMELTGERVRSLRRVNVLGLRIFDLRGGETISVSCRGRCSRGLAAQRKVGRRTTGLSLDRAMGKAWLRTDATLVIRIARPEHATKIQFFRMRQRGGPVPWVRALDCELPDGGDDEDCDGFRDLAVVRASARLRAVAGRRATRLQSLRVRGLGGGETVSLSCRGAGCTPAMTLTTTMLAGADVLRLDRVVRGVELRPGARLQLSAGRPDFASRVFRWVIRAGREPVRRELCQDPGERPGRCRGA